MRILHTADWHLGKSFKNFDLLQGQQYALQQLTDLIRSEKPDVLLIAGDIYDRSVPPACVVELFDEVMSEIVLELKTPVIAIAGNHDSAERIDYFNGLLQRQGLYIFGKPGITTPVVLHDAHGEVHFHPIPYTEPTNLRLPENDKAYFDSHEAVMRHLVANITRKTSSQARHVAVGHAFISGGESCESERALMSVGGASVVPAEVFAPFHYTAQGHLHRPQSFMDGRVRYSGSLLKYSFSEADHQKVFLMVEIDGKGQIQTEKIPIVPKQDVRRVKGYVRNGLFQLAENQATVSQDDLLEVTLLNEEPVINAMEIVKRQYPHALEVRQPNAYRNYSESRLSTEQLSKMDDREIARTFFLRYLPDLDATHEKIITQIIREIQLDA
ncbi:MAG: exonuclease SbcCD subunit D [Cytophagales bacterium]|nr:exonuclease SbcCD subunit D [Bernardetiaceae bacterium]MDW8205649.1 exonuclease SbcCD subunit D [Cytophagales bacterium]